MKVLPLIVFSLMSCALNDPPVSASEDVAPCHFPVKIERTDSKIVFTPCNGDPTEVSFAELKGDRGAAGAQGESGPRGPAGSGSSEVMVTVCRHDPQSHLDKTWSISVGDLITTSWGHDSRFDYAGSCQYENQCVCDRCGYHFDEPKFIHG